MKTSAVPMIAVLLAGVVGGCHPAAAPAAPYPAAVEWWKGNLHTHSLWSDGDDYPESILDWYRQRGYHFVAMSDHNILPTEERWVDVVRSRGAREGLARYVERLGEEWVEERQEGDTTLVRLRTVEEYRARLDEPGVFVVLPAEEITQYVGGQAVHVNATNLAEVIPERRGTRREILQGNLDAVRAQRERTGQPMIAHVNHPNWLYSLTAEDLIAVRDARFFEVYNAHPAVNNQGDDLHPGVERIWDIVLTERLSRGGEVLYAVATDDAHDYHRWAADQRNPGRAWVMVRAPSLSADALIAALEAGEFYASTGVELEDLRRDGDRLSLRIRPEPGVTYTTRFIGTRAGYDPRSEPRQDTAGTAITREYSDEIGTVLAEVEGISPGYRITGEEIYVRAKVISSKAKENAPAMGETEVAWTQPLVISPGTRAEIRDTLSVVTLNIWHDQRDWPARLDYMVRELRRLYPDVIALQEVLQHEALPNQAETFARMLGYDYHFTSVDPVHRPRRYGNAILTRHPVLARSWKALDPRDDFRTVAHLRIAFGDAEIDLYNTHLHHTGEGGPIRREQLDDLLGFIGSTRGDGPAILAGDFNAPVEAPEMALLDDHFVDAYGAIHTDPEARARTTLNPHIGHVPRRIDHVFLERGAFEPLDARIILDLPYATDAWASDHFGVLARLRLNGPR